MQPVVGVAGGLTSPTGLADTYWELPIVGEVRKAALNLLVSLNIH